jgi:nickel-dependent lactate racemase
MPSGTIRWGAWYDDIDVELAFPDGWTVEQCDPHDAPDMEAAAIAAAIADPVGSLPLRDLAIGRSRPCIVIDDLSRPTRGDLLLPPILDELRAAGIPAEDVLILGGVANHRPMVRADLLKKIGPEVLAACRYRNHFSFDNCVAVGDVEINRDYVESDLRILVGSIIPHAGAGFSGGAKLLMPGIASAATALAYHRGPSLDGRYDDVEVAARRRSEDVAGLVGVDFIVNSVPTSRLGVAAVVAGDVVEAHRHGVAVARRVFATPAPTAGSVDVCVLSLYPKDTEFLQHITAFAPWKTAEEPIVRAGGTFVIAIAGTEGMGTHHLFGPGMPLAAARATRVRDRNVVLWCPTLERGELDPAVAAATTLVRSWPEAMARIEAEHGPRGTAAVYPCATMQLTSTEG